MNLLMVLANVIGFLALAAATLKVLDTGPIIGPAFSPAARLVLLVLVFLSLYAAIEALSWRGAMRPGQATLVFVMGLFAVWRAFTPVWTGFLERMPLWHRAQPPAPRGPF